MRMFVSQKMEAAYYDNIIEQQRIEPEFFRMGFYGRKFPFFLRVRLLKSGPVFIALKMTQSDVQSLLFFACFHQVFFNICLLSISRWEKHCNSQLSSLHLCCYFSHAVSRELQYWAAAAKSLLALMMLVFGSRVYTLVLQQQSDKHRKHWSMLVNAEVLQQLKSSIFQWGKQWGEKIFVVNLVERTEIWLYYSLTAGYANLVVF